MGAAPHAPNTQPWPCAFKKPISPSGLVNEILMYWVKAYLARRSSVLLRTVVFGSWEFTFPPAALTRVVNMMECCTDEHQAQRKL